MAKKGTTWHGKTIEQRFREKYIILENGCWEWQASKSKDGYGYFRMGDKMEKAHRVWMT